MTASHPPLPTCLPAYCSCGWSQPGDPETRQGRKEEWAVLGSGISLPAYHQPHKRPSPPAVLVPQLLRLAVS